MNRRNLFRIGITGLLWLLIGCSVQRPVLYPNAKFNDSGAQVAERDIDRCMQKAEEHVSSGEGSGNVAESTAVAAGTGAAIGAAGGAAGGAIIGQAGRGAAVGAAGGGAAGATRGLLRGVLGSRRPDPIFKSFVNRCLRDKGYDPIGWK